MKIAPVGVLLLCISAIITAGCTTSSPGTSGAVNPVQTPSSSVAARSLPSSLSLDPIVALWKSPGPAYQFGINFDVNGNTQETNANQPGIIYNGTWQPVGKSMYLVTRDTGEKTVWVYNSNSNTVAKQSIPGIIYSLYQGGTDTSSALLSGTGNMVVPFTATASGMWAFTMNYTGERNYVVWLTDGVGSRVALLANRIGTGSVIITKQIPEGKYYLDVTASGPWTFQAELP